MKFLLSNSDYRFMMILWEKQPIASGTLAELCLEQFGWKKSTTYTVIKRLIDKGFVKNEKTIVTALISKEDCQREEAQAFINRAFSGSLPDFLATFLDNFTISEKEEEEIRDIIDDYTKKHADSKNSGE